MSVSTSVILTKINLCLLERLMENWNMWFLRLYYEVILLYWHYVERHKKEIKGKQTDGEFCKNYIKNEKA
jgi:hypothetical protein